jgi:hypothetical protein
MPILPAIAAAAVSSGISAFASNRAQKKNQQALDEANTQTNDLALERAAEARELIDAGYDLSGFDLEGVFGRNPSAVYDELGGLTDFFTPLTESDPGLRQTFADAIAGNQANLPGATGLSRDINAEITRDARARVAGYDPLALGNVRQLGANTALALQGIIPANDRIQIAQNRAEQRNAVGGVAGNTDRLTARDLGLTQLGLMTQTGPQMLQSTLAAIGQIDPLNRRSRPTDFLADPGFVARTAAAENQTNAEFARSERDTALGIYTRPNPSEAGQANLQMQRAGIEAGILAGLPINTPSIAPASPYLTGSAFGDQSLGQVGKSLAEEIGKLFGSGQPATVTSPGGNYANAGIPGYTPSLQLPYSVPGRDQYVNFFSDESYGI